MLSQRCRVRVLAVKTDATLAKCAKPGKQMCMKYKGQNNQGERGSERAINFPRDDSAHSLFLGTAQNTPNANPLWKSLADLRL